MSMMLPHLCTEVNDATTTYSYDPFAQNSLASRLSTLFLARGKEAGNKKEQMSSQFHGSFTPNVILLVVVTCP